jgi:hypothetical protein
VAFLAETKLLGKQGGSGGGCVRGTPRRNAGVERANSAIVEIISAFSWITVIISKLDFQNRSG